MLNRVEWDGRRWYQNARDGYFRNRSGKLLHRAVWTHERGLIPPGWQVHHKDENRANNAIENLEAMPPSQHQQQHEPRGWVGWDTSRRRANSVAAWDRRTPERVVCEQCSKTFSTTGMRSRFCSHNCRSTHRRASGVDNEDRKCIQCSSPFTVNRYKQATSCSRLCAQRYRRAPKVPGL